MNDNPKFPTSLSSLQQFYREAKKVIKDLTYRDIVAWIKQSETYTMHKSARKNFRREQIYTNSIDYLWEIDLVDVSRLKEDNDGYTFLLVCIDTFSKYVWIRPLKKKTGKATVEAFTDSVSKDVRTPKNLHYDQGTEFTNRQFQQLIKSMNSNGYEAINDTKGAIVERVTRTLKNKMYRYFKGENTFRYMDVLQDLVESYNTTYHRSIGMKPSQVKSQNEFQVFRRLFPASHLRKRRVELKKGDHVRISHKKRMFDKEHAATWTEEIFKIKEVINESTPPTFIIEDLLGEEIEGKFYKEQLQKVKLPNSFIVEKIHCRRKRKGITEVLVSWRGYPDKFMQWLPQKDIQVIST